MKKLVYLVTALAMIASLSLVTGRSYAAGSHASLMSVRLCSSTPVNIPGDQHISQGIFHGVQVATNEWRSKLKKVGINLLSPLTMNDSNAGGTSVYAPKETSNAHECLSDGSAMAYIGTLNSSMAQVSEPILNQGHMAMISPANSNPILTDPGHRAQYEPATYHHQIKYPTYYRVVTTDSLQGPVGALYMKNNLHIKNFYLVDDQQTYGAGLAKHMSDFATKHLGMKEVGSGHLDVNNIATTSQAVAQQAVAAKPQAVYCGCDEPYSGPMLKALRRGGFKGYYVGGDAINDNSFGKFAGGNPNLFKTYSTFVGNPAAVPAAFKTKEHKYFPGFAAGPYDALAYDASNIALNAIYQAKKAGKLKGSPTARRAAILPYISDVHWKGTIGTITFDHNGDTSLRILTAWGWKGSAWSLKKVYRGKAIPGYLKPTP
jgi:branched-chain amino acid transport system substrate-binding protein